MGLGVGGRNMGVGKGALRWVAREGLEVLGREDREPMPPWRGSSGCGT